MKGEQASGFPFFPQQCWGWERNTITAHIRINLSVFSSFPSTEHPHQRPVLLFEMPLVSREVFYLKQDSYLNTFYCIFIAPLVLLQFSTSKRRLHHLHVDYTNMSDICNLIGLQLKKCFQLVIKYAALLEEPAI